MKKHPEPIGSGGFFVRQRCKSEGSGAQCVSGIGCSCAGGPGRLPPPGVISGRSCAPGPFGRLAVEARQVMARLVHHLHHLVVGYQVRAVGERGVDVGVEGSCGSDGVALDARDLDEAADGVAGHAEVVLQAHLRRILYLRRRAAEELAGGRRGHGAGHTDLALASHLRAGDRGVVLDDVAEEPRPRRGPGGCGCAGSRARWPGGRVPQVRRRSNRMSEPSPRYLPPHSPRRWRAHRRRSSRATSGSRCSSST